LHFDIRKCKITKLKTRKLRTVATALATDKPGQHRDAGVGRPTNIRNLRTGVPG
jgi:hypothetical protein